MACPCGKWLSSSEQGRAFCNDHSIDRRHRFRKTLFNSKYSVPAVSAYPAAFRAKHLRLFATYDDVDNTGCRIFCLALRSDVAAVRSFSKTLYSRGGCVDRVNYVAWCMLAQRLYDPACIQSVLQPFVLWLSSSSSSSSTRTNLLDFNLVSLKELRKQLREYNRRASEVVYGTKQCYRVFESKQCNPTGRAGLHSGHTFLADIINTKGAVGDFLKLCSDVADVLFARHDSCRPHHSDKVTEAVDNTCVLHSGSYYKMSMCRTALHCIRKSNYQGGLAWPPCEYSEDLWTMLLGAGGSQAGACQFGLTGFADAISFCEDMRKRLPTYCLCDLACWLCLAHDRESARPQKRKRR